MHLNPDVVKEWDSKAIKTKIWDFFWKSFFLKNNFVLEKLGQFSQSESGESANFIKAMDLKVS